VIVSRAFRLADPRSFGSGNPGATNVLRSGSKAAALLTLLGDAAKGWLAMFVAAKVGAGDTAIAVAGLAAFLGHVFPFTLGFRGGKGVATALGVLLGFSGALAGVTAAVWLAVVVFTRYSSLGALAAAAAAPVATVWLVAAGQRRNHGDRDRHVRSPDLPPQEQHPQVAGWQRRPHRRPKARLEPVPSSPLTGAVRRCGT
jgi:acyl-phosphate glycerol 3-phosphate acyltransferase